MGLSRRLWVALASSCCLLCAEFNSKSKGTNQVVLTFIFERELFTLNHSFRFIAPESIVLDFARGLWTEQKLSCC